MNDVIKAKYLGTDRFDGPVTFELNVETHKFVMVGNPEFQYDDLYVYDDPDFLVYQVITEDSNILKTGSTTEYEKVETMKMFNV